MSARKCWHCGATTDARLLGGVLDPSIRYEHEPIAEEHGTRYEVFICKACGEPFVESGAWHPFMEDDDEQWLGEAVLPTERTFKASELYASYEADREGMERAVQEARKITNPDRPESPRVGAALALHGRLLDAAYRGERNAGDHAEYTLLKKKLPKDASAGATLYTTLEPCTERGPDKLACVQHIIDHKVSRVVVGMLDPNSKIRGLGVLLLRSHNIEVSFFPKDLMESIEALNSDFVADQRKKNKARESVLEQRIDRSLAARLRFLFSGDI